MGSYVVTIRRRILDYSLAGLLCLIPFLLLRANLKDPGQVSGFDHAVLRISAPLQAAVSWLVEGVAGLVTDYVWLVDVEDENDELRADNQRLHREIAELRRRVDDTQALERLAVLRKQTAAETIGARVVGASLSPYFRVLRLRLDRGEGEVAAGMPVVSADNALVGRIQRTYGRYSDVLLTTDPQSSIEVVIERTGARGLITGMGRADSYRCKVQYLERDDAVVVGDKVITSGLGGTVPAGLAVGAISAVAGDEGGLYQDVEVTPAIDFGRLDNALVVVSPPPPPDPTPTAGAAPPTVRLRPF